MFTPKHIKNGKMLLKGVAKFLHYKRDVLSEEKLAETQEKRDAFRALLKTGTPEEVSEGAKELQKVCERSLPMPSHPGIRENVEVFFVAIVIALGIRSYFLQPFKIPTGSMQPTLNGIIGYGVGESREDLQDDDESALPEDVLADVAGEEPEGALTVIREDWDKVEPNLLKKGWDLFWCGRNYVDLVAKEDMVVNGFYQKNTLKFFPSPASSGARSMASR